MTYLALDKSTHDIIFPVGGGISRVGDGRFVVQQVKCKLSTWLGEWVLDPRVGWITLSDLEKNFSLYELEDRARKIILGTDGVQSISFIKVTYKSRKLTIEAEMQTIYGGIILTVPWGVQ